MADRSGPEHGRGIIGGAAAAWRAGPLEAVPGRRRTAVILLFCMAVAFFARAWSLGHSGVVGFDETYYYILGRNLVTGGGYSLNGLPHTAFPPLYPLLVGTASLLIAEMNYCIWIVTAVAGALLPLPVYLVASDIHGRRTGLFAAGAAAVWPALFFYAVKSVPYSQRLYAGSEPLYVTVFVTGAVFLWLTSRRPGWRYAAASGFFFGLAWLSRSEGPAVFAFLFIWFVADGVLTRRLFKVREMLRAALVPVIALAVFSPFLIHLHSATGTWTLGSKLQDKARIRESFWRWIQEDDNIGFMQIHYALNDDGTWMEEPYWGISDWHGREMREGEADARTMAVIRDLDRRWLPYFAGMFFGGEYPLVPAYAWALLAAGLLIPSWSVVRLRWWGFAAANAAPFAVMAVTVSCIPRYVMPLMPLFAVGAARGLCGLEAVARGALGALAPGRDKLVRALPLAVALAVLGYMLYHGVEMNLAGSRVSPKKTALVNQTPERRLAEYLRGTLPEGAGFMCMRPWLAARAGLDWRVVPLADVRDIIAYGQSRGIRFALLEPWQIRDDEREVLAPHVVEELDYGVIFTLLDLEKGPRIAPRGAAARSGGGGG